MIAELLTEPPASPPSTWGPYRRQDYDQLPAEPRCELLYGRLYVSPSPSLRHQVVTLYLWQHLEAIAAEHGGLAVAAPLDVVLADHSVVQPDVLYLSAARRSLGGHCIEGAPDLVVEVLSPGGARRDRGEKLKLYAESGVREYWLVEPQEAQIEFLVCHQGQFQVHLPADGRYHSAALPEIDLDLEAFWTQVRSRLAG